MKFKTEPFAHQRRAMDAARPVLASKGLFALFMDQRTGKTKVGQDLAAEMFEAQEIVTLLAISHPNGVQRVWAEEAATHCAAPYWPVVWTGGNGKRWQAEADRAFKTRDLLFVSMNVEATIFPRGKDFLRDVIKRGPFLCIYDESTSIAEPGASRSKVAHQLGKHAKKRIIMTGTPADGGPLKLYSQFKFLRHGLLGFNSYLAFKHRYAVWEKAVKTLPSGKTQEYDTLKGYINLEELHEKIKPYSFRVRKEDCFDLPPRTYQKRYFQLGKEQRFQYEKLAEEYRIELKTGTVTASHVLTRYLRLQQITSGFVPLDRSAAICPRCSGDGCEACGDIGWIGAEPRVERFRSNPRLDALVEEAKMVRGQFLVFCRFTFDIEVVLQRFAEEGVSAVRFDGKTARSLREKNMDAYKAEKVQGLVAQTQAVARSYELAANTTDAFYYTNYFGLELRRQSEDRAYGPKTKNKLGVTDFIAENTVDEKIVESLRAGKRLADLIAGDPQGDWI